MKRYERYKPSGIPWIGEIPEHWEIKRLKFLGDIRYGLGTLPKLKPEGLRLIRATDIQRGRVVDTEVVFVDPDDVPYERDPVLREDDIVVVRSGAYTGDSAIILQEYEGSVVGYDMVFRVRRTNALFISYCLLSHYVLHTQIYRHRLRAAQPHVNREELGETLIIVPEDAEQITIAEYLRAKTAQIDDLISKKQQLIDLLNEEKTAIINHAVTKGLNPSAPMKDSGIPWLGKVPAHWEVNRLKYIARVFRGKFSHRPRNDGRLYNGQFPFIQTGEVARATKYLNEFSQTLNEEGRKVTTEFPAGTLLMTIAANVGEVAILGIDACFPDSIVGFYPRPFLDNEFLFYKLKSLKEEFIRASIINTQLNLNIDRISAISISFPSKDEQTQIVQHIEAEMQKTDSTIAKIEKEILLLQEYREALISEAVTGKIDVRGAC